MDAALSSSKTLTARELLASLVAFDTTSAKSNLALLQSQFQVSAPPGDDGKTAVLDDTGRKQAIDKAQDQVSFYCK